MSDDADLMGTAEVAAFLGVTRQRVLALAKTSDTFPAPLAVLSMGKVWDGDKVREWARTHKPKTQR